MPAERRGWTWLAWLVILGLCGWVVARNMARPAGEESERIGLQSQGRYLLGLKSFEFDDEDLLRSTRSTFDKEGERGQLALAALTLEFLGPDAAWVELLGQESRSADILRRIGEGESPSKEDAQWLVEDLDWFGKLALAQHDEELHASLVREGRRTVVVILSLVILGLCGLLLGVAILVGMMVAAGFNWLPPPQFEGEHGGIYAETFALYLVLFLGMNWLFTFVATKDTSLAYGGLAMIGSLAAVGWPLLRGVGRRQMCEDLGLTFRWWDVPAGIGTYLASLPLLVVGVIIALLLMGMLKLLNVPYRMPSHPVGEMGSSLGGWGWVILFAVACIGAPLVEELFFRGVLFSHLNRIGKSWAAPARLFLSVGVSSFLFAVIHPQGWLGVPVLAALATGFALGREWTGGLVPSMVAHSMNNTVATLVLYLAIA